ncbi:hypothetical protein CSC28_5270 [Pseudomonas paraeruginosa]|nr:hypothetical protein CSC28_5270 [Pseudomonas paraeruginosa]
MRFVRPSEPRAGDDIPLSCAWGKAWAGQASAATGGGEIAAFFY